MQTKYNILQLKEACALSTSYRQVLLKLGLIEAGGNYTSIKKMIKSNDIDISHFTHRGWNKGLKFIPKKPQPLQNLLVQGSNYQSHKLRIRLIKESYFEHKCYNCHNRTWMGKPIPLELEHIDGDPANNSIDNLTLLCPNCHALTPTFRRRKR